jgi:hypothetical protein
MERHGNVKVARESSGLQFYIACPDCLKSDGESELYKMHLAIGVDRYLSGYTGAAQCMKTGKTFFIDELTLWVPLQKRGYEPGPGKIIDQAMTTTEFLEPDEQGRMVPKSPGETVPLSQLPLDHPAMIYLHSRQFNPAELEHQFNASFCVQERKEIRYRRLLGGFRATPRGRIIFEIRINGIRRGWQGRVLEMSDEHRLYYLHPYSEQWVAVKYRNTITGSWDPLEGFEDFDMPKYIAAHGMRRNSVVMGYDSACAFNTARPGKKSWCFVCEGPLDAGRLGPPAVAVCGKFFSEEQAGLLADAFDVLIVTPDNDAAGSKLPEYVAHWIGATRRVVVVNPPAHCKDAGEMTPEEARLFRLGAMEKAGVL